MSVCAVKVETMNPVKQFVGGCINLIEAVSVDVMERCGWGAVAALEFKCLCLFGFITPNTH